MCEIVNADKIWPCITQYSNVENKNMRTTYIHLLMHLLSYYLCVCRVGGGGCHHLPKEKLCPAFHAEHTATSHHHNILIIKLRRARDMAVHVWKVLRFQTFVQDILLLPTLLPFQNINTAGNL